MYTVVYAEFMHETNSFSVRRTGEREFAQGHLYRGAQAVQAFARTHTSAGAALAAAERFGWRLHIPLAAEATPSGLVEAAFFERCAVPDGMLFVAGDHRTVSRDSRHFGPVAVTNVVARVAWRLMPFERFGTVR